MKIHSYFLLCGITLLFACTNEPPPETEQLTLADTTPPTISDVILNRNPNPSVPLAAILSLSTNEPTKVTIRIDDGERSWDATKSNGFANDHSLMVLGMRPGRVHKITALVSDTTGNTTETRPLSMEMPPLPKGIPQPQVLISQPDKMEPGVTLFNVNRIGDDGKPVADLKTLLIVDDHGEVIWYHRRYDGAGDARRISNGNLLLQAGDNRIVEIDMLGNTINHWHARQVDTETVPDNSIHVETNTFHHEVVELPSGSLLTLSREARVIDDFPTSESDPNAPSMPATVASDVVVEFARDGTLLHEWSLLDILDPRRLSHDSLNAGGNMNQHYGYLSEDVPLRDWSHSNAVSYDPNDDSFIVSVRHQDAVVKIDRESGALIWILGTHENWRVPWSDYLLEPEGELQWQFHEHGPEVGENGSIVMFDNGNGRASAFHEELPLDQRYSRAVEYSIDPDAMTVSQLWDYGGLGEEWFYSRYIGDADWLPITGNVLVTDGGRQDDADGKPSDEDDRQRWAQIFELTHTEPAEKIFHLVLKDEPPAGYQVYRAQRLSSLYPE
jgi:arylsulfate sulfotransferase